MSQDQQIPSRELDDIFSFPGHDKAEAPKPADDPIGAMKGFVFAGFTFEAGNNLLGNLNSFSVGTMPGGSGFEAAVAEMAPANTPTAPTMTRGISPAA